MAEKVEIIELRIDGEARQTERAELLLHDVGLSWTIEIESSDLALAGRMCGDNVTVEMQTADGVITGDARVLRCIGTSPAHIEMFGVGDLLKGEEVFRPLYNAP
jgi:hypothetical protein